VQRTSSNQLLYESITLNGVTNNLNWTFSPGSYPGWYGVTVSYQQDGNYQQASYDIYLDEFTLISFAIALQDAPASRKVSIRFCLTKIGGRPSRFPLARALRKPAFTRSTIRLRSSSATAADGRYVRPELCSEVGSLAGQIQEPLSAVEHGLPVPFLLGPLYLDRQGLDVGDALPYLTRSEVLALVLHCRKWRFLHPGREIVMCGFGQTKNPTAF
jgi:hypothetical protein